MTDVVIREPLTYIERQVAIAFVKLGYEVEILPASYSAKVLSMDPILFAPLSDPDPRPIGINELNPLAWWRYYKKRNRFDVYRSTNEDNKV